MRTRSCWIPSVIFLRLGFEATKFSRPASASLDCLSSIWSSSRTALISMFTGYLSTSARPQNLSTWTIRFLGLARRVTSPIVRAIRPDQCHPCVLPERPLTCQSTREVSFATKRSEFSQHINLYDPTLDRSQYPRHESLTSKRETSVVGPKLASESTGCHGHRRGIGTRKPDNSGTEDSAVGRTCTQKEQLSQAHRRNINIPPNQRCCNLPSGTEAASHQQNRDVLSQRISCLDERCSRCLRASGNQHHLSGAVPKGTKRLAEGESMNALLVAELSISAGRSPARRAPPVDADLVSVVHPPRFRIRRPPNGIISHSLRGMPGGLP